MAGRSIHSVECVVVSPEHDRARARRSQTLPRSGIRRASSSSVSVSSASSPPSSQASARSARPVGDPGAFRRSAWAAVRARMGSPRASASSASMSKPSAPESAISTRPTQRATVSERRTLHLYHAFRSSHFFTIAPERPSQTQRKLRGTERVQGYMIGILVGTACLIGLAKVIRGSRYGGRGRHGGCGRHDRFLADRPLVQHVEPS